ncbi:hypothetical protein [[Mycoplasma] mobile]|uniref:Internal repeat-containing expressed protein n=1 Tax=Mycoplasma mobile (strain ATCC 43663 / 163K / NCTC 11711) TaxID=267748 RepID=Q6KHX9_MYCM1|nr:hypothetical protein [[Mycoplasma] mobile]AAT27797.1 internal repeat-containing expressed protein [Mycoplasma mobile 163K]
MKIFKKNKKIKKISKKTTDELFVENSLILPVENENKTNEVNLYNSKSYAGPYRFDPFKNKNIETNTLDLKVAATFFPSGKESISNINSFKKSNKNYEIETNLGNNFENKIESDLIFPGYLENFKRTNKTFREESKIQKNPINEYENNSFHDLNKKLDFSEYDFSKLKDFSNNKIEKEEYKEIFSNSYSNTQENSLAVNKIETNNLNQKEYSLGDFSETIFIQNDASQQNQDVSNFPNLEKTKDDLNFNTGSKNEIENSDFFQSSFNSNSDTFNQNKNVKEYSIPKPEYIPKKQVNTNNTQEQIVFQQEPVSPLNKAKPYEYAFNQQFEYIPKKQVNTNNTQEQIVFQQEPVSPLNKAKPYEYAFNQQFEYIPKKQVNTNNTQEQIIFSQPQNNKRTVGYEYAFGQQFNYIPKKQMNNNGNIQEQIVFQQEPVSPLNKAKPYEYAFNQQFEYIPKKQVNTNNTQEQIIFSQPQNNKRTVGYEYAFGQQFNYIPKKQMNNNDYSNTQEQIVFQQEPVSPLNKAKPYEYAFNQQFEYIPKKQVNTNNTQEQIIFSQPQNNKRTVGYEYAFGQQFEYIPKKQVNTNNTQEQIIFFQPQNNKRTIGYEYAFGQQFEYIPKKQVNNTQEKIIFTNNSVVNKGQTYEYNSKVSYIPKKWNV